MAIWNRTIPKKEIDWKEIAKDLRADLVAPRFAYRGTTYYK